MTPGVKWRVSCRREIKWCKQDYLPNMATSASIAQSSNNGKQTFGVFFAANFTMSFADLRRSEKLSTESIGKS